MPDGVLCSAAGHLITENRLTQIGGQRSICPQVRPISFIRIRYIMEYIYIQLDQIFRANSCYDAFASSGSCRFTQAQAVYLDIHFAWGCFADFDSGPRTGVSTHRIV
jgi:hypothetical protein